MIAESNASITNWSDRWATGLGRLRRPNAMVAISITYLTAATLIMTWRGIEVSPDYILMLCVPIALLAGRLIRFVKDWVPFIALFLGYEAMRGIAPKLGVGPHVADVAFLERIFFLGHYPGAILQALTPAGAIHNTLTFIATAIYLCHFIFPLGVGLVLWHLNHIQFRRFTVALLGMSFVAFIIYLLAPTAPPWYATSQGTICCIHDWVSNSLPTAWSPIYNAFDSNSFAAFPSLHAAYPFLAYLALREISPRGGKVVLAWAIVVWFVVVFLGEHYAVDVMAGIALSAAAWLVTKRLIKDGSESVSSASSRVPQLESYSWKRG
jgi:membrane-associated phospholipid phosphatase